jgi:hypothetical protein
MKQFLHSEPLALSDEAGGEDEYLDRLQYLRDPELWERFAADLQTELKAAHPGARVERSCNIPAPDLPNLPIHEAYVRLKVERKWGPLWVYFTPEGMELCKTSPDWGKGLLHAAEPFCSVKYEDPRFFPLLERVLAALGFPVTWGH